MVNLVCNVVAIVLGAFLLWKVLHLIKVSKSLDVVNPWLETYLLVKELTDKVETQVTLAEKVAEELTNTLGVSRQEFRRVVQLISELEGSISVTKKAALHTEELEEEAAENLVIKESRAAKVKGGEPGVVADAAALPAHNTRKADPRGKSTKK